MNITFNGDPITLVGEKIKVGDNAPDFLVVDNNLKNVTLSDTSGKRIFITVPSIDTSVCDMEVRKFNEEATKLKDVTVYVAKSPKAAAKNTTTFLSILSFNNFQSPNDTSGPTIAIENAFAPRVVIPP